MPRCRPGAATAAALAAMATATACSHGTLAQTFDVKPPEVKGGYLELGLDNTIQSRRPGDNRSAHDQSLDWGVTDWWRLSGVVALESPVDGEFRVARTVVENLFVLGKLGASQARPEVGFGWFTAVEISTHPDTTNALIFGPIISVKRDQLSLTLNPFLEKTFGLNRVEGVALAYGWQAKYEVRPDFAIGIEGFGLIENLGDARGWEQQQHRIGPVVYAEIALTKDLKITPDIGVLFGLTDATPDVTFKFNIGVPLHQR